MRALNDQEIEQVSGGLFSFASLESAEFSAPSKYLSGNSLSHGYGMGSWGSRTSPTMYSGSLQSSGFQFAAGTGGGGAGVMTTVMKSEPE